MAKKVLTKKQEELQRTRKLLKLNYNATEKKGAEKTAAKKALKAGEATGGRVSNG